MREIKFRAWYGSKMIPVSLLEKFADRMVVNNYMNIGPGHLMQFTGLHDKNGKEIYEGDILGTTPNDICPNLIFPPVEFGYYDNGGDYEASDTGYGWNQGGEYSLAHPPFSGEDGSKIDYIILGNIHENPDLPHP